MKIKLSTVAIATIISTSSIYATSDIEAKINALAEEIAILKEQQAAQVNENKLSLGGYGKMDYTKSDNTSNAQLDIYRAIFYVGYKFNDDVKFVSEIEFEHGGRESTGGYGIVEQAYIDVAVNDYTNLKIGHMIVPVGMVNLYHEPTTFNAVNRPLTEKYIIPSTWHENGVIAYGKVDNISYQAGIVAGLRATDFKDTYVQTNLRDMRQNGQKSESDDFAVVARVDYAGNGYNIGGSMFLGEADQGNSAAAGVSTTISEVHASTNVNGVQLDALYAKSEIDAPTSMNGANYGTDSDEKLDGNGEGYYINAAYTIDKITPFVRYEDLEIKAQDGTAGSKKAESTTVGINYNITPKVVLKADYITYKDTDNVTEFGVGWVF